jgi:superfamily II DNA or RNA helicase
MKVQLDQHSLESYRQFLAIKRLPIYSFAGRVAEFPDEYASLIGMAPAAKNATEPTVASHCFDYQRDIAKIAIKKEKYALYLDCGLGKSIIYFEFAKHVLLNVDGGGGVLILCPLMVCSQMLDECRRFYPDLPAEIVPSNKLDEWTQTCDGKLGISNFESMRSSVERGQLSALIVDESSILKSHFGKYGREIIRLGKGMRWKLSGTGTPAPNDRIEFANHAVFLDKDPTVNAFLAKYFINRGETQERWELRPHAIEPFYRSLSHWSIFMTNPATYGWQDNCESIPPINVHIHDVDMTQSQHEAVRNATGSLFAHSVGGITQRTKLSKIAKGLDGSESIKYQFIVNMINSWPDESTLVWCWYNEEQNILSKLMPEAASISGATGHSERERLVAEFKAGERRVLISKPKVLGFGLNLQIATRQVFSSLIDSYESYYQAVKRSNRYGSTRPLNVHIPVLDVERPMVENVLRKAKNVMRDTEEQEQIFKRWRVKYAS